MLLRGRSASGVPAKIAGILADDFGIEALSSAATSNQADNRRSAAGALLGYALGVGLGGAYGLVRPGLGRMSTPLAGVAVGVVAMTAADASYAVTGASDPKTWTVTDWISRPGAPHHLRSGHCRDLRDDRAVTAHLDRST